MSQQKQKITIVGAGIGGLVTALQLSKTTAQRERFDIEIYQQGWRLGGKCATGRNSEHGNRIEEHGIHGFLGSYFNALPLMRDLYDEWQPEPQSPIQTFEDAFPTENSAFFWEWDNDRLLRWENYRKPSGNTLDDAPKFKTLASWLKPLIHGILESMRAEGLDPSKDDEIPGEEQDDPDDDVLATCKAIESELTLVKTGRNLSQMIGFSKAPEPEDDIDWSKLNALLAKPIPDTTGMPPEIRRKVLRLEFIVIMLRGIRDDKILQNGLRSVDDEDFRHWMERHGASKGLLQAPITLATINTTYQYPDGDTAKLPVMSAASYIMWTLRALVDLGGAYFLFHAGSGDTIVAPAYEVLRQRGVKIHFFHRLKHIEMSEDASAVSALLFDVQARTKGDVEYEPLVTVKGLKAWPASPDLGQLEHGEELAGIDFESPWVDNPHQGVKILRNQEDFDTVVLAIPPRAVELAARDLCQAHPKWGQMASGMAVTATQAAQLWLNVPVKDLDDRGTKFHLAGNYMSGLHGHVDFGKFLKFETWPQDNAPKGLMFFSGVMRATADMHTPRGEMAADIKVKEAALELLTSGGARLLPKAGLNIDESGASPFTLDFDFVYSDRPKGWEKFDSQYWRANIRPSELYTQSPPGTRAQRISPLETGVDNLTCAGDWVDTVLNVGSFEGATMGGMLAACKIDGSLSIDDIIGTAPTKADSPLWSPMV